MNFDVNGSVGHMSNGMVYGESEVILKFGH